MNAPLAPLHPRFLLTEFKWMIILEGLAQGFVLAVVLFGWYLCTFHVGIDWLIRLHKSYVLGGVYLICVNILILSVVALYLYLSSGRGTHNIACYSLPDKSLLTEPYPCIDMNGNLPTCDKGRCNKIWKPPRTHHCSTCGVCRLEFDHHCPWLGNCVTLSKLKSFITFLFLVPSTFLVAVLPIARILPRHIILALDTSKQDEWAIRIWWDWLGSWILCAGPFGRWVVGAILGFWLLGQKREREEPLPPGHLIEQPHLRVIMTAGFALLFSVFAFIMGIVSIRKVFQGVTTLEHSRPPTPKALSRYHLVCIPRTAIDDALVAPLLPNERMYDLGKACNWKLFQAKPLIFTSTPCSYTWPKLNPTMIHRMRAIQANRREQPQPMVHV